MTTDVGGDDSKQLSEGPFWGLAAALVFTAYALVFLLVGREGWVGAMLASLRNLAPLALLAVGLRAILRRHLLAWPVWRQLGAHVVLAIGFSLLWYWLLMLTIGLAVGRSPIEFEVRQFFSDPAVTWQMLQGVTVYALIVALVALREHRPFQNDALQPQTMPEMREPSSLSRYFIRRGEDILPVEVARIVSIAGADDYAEVRTLDERHLVRMTLADLEAALPPERFIRAHRSHIINVDRVRRAEPAGGGRMLLHMEDGEIIQASRTGTRLLRDRVI